MKGEYFGYVKHIHNNTLEGLMHLKKKFNTAWGSKINFESSSHSRAKEEVCGQLKIRAIIKFIQKNFKNNIKFKQYKFKQ